MEHSQNPQSSLTALSSIGFLAWLSYEMIRSPVLPLFAQHLGISAAQIGLVVGASTITGIFLKLPSGVLSDLYSRKRLLLLGATVFGLAPFLYLWIEQPATLTGLRFLHGMATAVFAPVALAAIATLFRQRRAESLSWYSSATMAGGLLGPVAGGILIHRAGYPVTFVAAAAFGLMAFGLTLRLRLNEPQLQSPQKQKAWEEIRKRFIQGVRETAGDIRILATSATQAFQYMGIGTLQAFLPIYGLSVGLDATQVGILFGAQALLTILSKPLLGRWADRIGRKPVILSGLCLSAAILWGIPWINSFTGLLILSAVFGLGVALVTSSVSALVADLCQEKHYGSAMGLFGTIMDVGHAAGPIAAGFLIALYNYATAFAVVSALLLLSALCFVILVRTHHS